MKKLSNYFLLLFLAAPLVFTSCSEDEEPGASGPSINITSDQDISNDEFTGYVGDTLFLDIEVNAQAGFNNLTVLINGSSDTTFSRQEGQTVNTFETTYAYPLTDDGDFTLTFRAVDDDNNQSTQIISVTAEDRPVNVFTERLLYAPDAEENNKNFFSTNNGETYSINDVEKTANLSSEIDFGYYYGATNKASLASPASYPAVVKDISDWNFHNETLLRKTELSVSEFLENQNDIEFIETAFDEGTSGTDTGIVTGLNVGDILAFELDDTKGNRRGLIRILDIEPGSDSNDFIEIEVIVIK